MKATFTKNQMLRLANILDNAGQVFLAGVVLTPLISGVDSGNKFMIVLGGIILTGFSWWTALRIERKIS